MLPNLRAPWLAAICVSLLLDAPFSLAAPPGLAVVLSGKTKTESPPESGTLSEEQPRTAKEALPEKRAAVQEQLRVAQQVLRESDEDTVISPSVDTEKVGLLKQLDLVYAQQESTLARTKELEAALAKAKDAKKDLEDNGLQEPKPYSFFLQESLQDALVSNREQLKSVSTTMESVTQSLARAKEAADAKEKQRRLAKEKAAADTSGSDEAASSYELAKRESDIAAAKVETRKSELANIKLEQETLQIQSEFYAEKLRRIAHEVTFSEEDLKERLRELTKMEKDITRRSKENDAEMSILMSEWGKARQLLYKAEKANQTTEALQAEVKAKKFAHSLLSNRAEYFTNQGTCVQRLRGVWDRRYRVATGEFETADLSEWRNEVKDLLEDITAENALYDNRREELRKKLADGKRVASEDGDSEVDRQIAYQGQAIRDQIEFVNDHLARLDATARIANKLANEIRDRTSHFSVAEWAGVIWNKVVFVWEYELTEPEEDQPALRVSSVVFGLLLLVLGYRFSRKISSIFGTQVLPRFGINDGGAAALQSLSFYALLFTSTLMALKLVSVPLTLFTFLGGAAAIGIGFGSQSILNNFISGLILLTEQPVRVGDLIELGGLVGCVESIGMRSTRIRTGSMQEIIIPNSSFLENNVINWTLTDTVIRCNIDVGVAYGSPTRDVAKWLKRSAEEHGLVLGKPEPFVWFAGFGDNSLNFELYFYITIRTLAERRRIESDLRFMIDQNFREAGICIAFPQRDLHLDTQRPLEVRMLPVEEKPGVEEQVAGPKAA